jgi:hypothetical protein
VIGRAAKLASIAGFLDLVDAGPAALVLSGEPGIGKTVLWPRGGRGAYPLWPGVVVSCCEAEEALSFSGLSELLTEVFDEVVLSLLPLRRRALEVAPLRTSRVIRVGSASFAHFEACSRAAAGSLREVRPSRFR